MENRNTMGKLKGGRGGRRQNACLKRRKKASKRQPSSIGSTAPNSQFRTAGTQATANLNGQDADNGSVTIQSPSVTDAPGPDSSNVSLTSARTRPLILSNWGPGKRPIIPEKITPPPRETAPIPYPPTKFIKVSSDELQRRAFIPPGQYLRIPKRISTASSTPTNRAVHPVQAEQSSTTKTTENAYQNTSTVRRRFQFRLNAGIGQLRSPSPEIIAMDHDYQSPQAAAAAENNGAVTIADLRKQLNEAREKNEEYKKKIEFDREYLTQTENFIERLNTVMGRLMDERQSWTEERERMQKFMTAAETEAAKAGKILPDFEDLISVQKANAYELMKVRAQLTAANCQLESVKISKSADERRHRMRVPFSTADNDTRRHQAENLKRLIESSADLLPGDGAERDKEIALVLGHVLTRKKPEWVDQELLKWI